MAKKKYKSEENIVVKDGKSIRMEGVQNLYNFLFEACNILRGPVSQDNFKDYITPILYFKRISDVYDEETQAALDESGGDNEYALLPEQHRFVIPDGCHWIDIRERTENLGAAIVGAMRGIELANPDTLYGVLSVFSAQKWTDKKNLSDSKIRDLIEHLSTRRLGNKDYPADLMGDAYEVLLKKFADDSKAKAGEFYTPRPVVNLLIRILDPKPGETVYDPACGSGGMLIEAIHMQGDTLRSPKILQGSEIAKFDCVIANPPFSLEKWGATEWSSDKFGRNIWGTPSDSCGDYAWIQHMVKSMAPGNSRMAVVMPQGILFRGNEDGRIREKMIKSDLIEAIVTLGDKLFYGTGLSPCFLILRRMKPAERSARILMIDATKILTQKRAQNILSPEDVDHIYQLYLDYKDVEDYSKVVTLKEIEDKEFNLSPNRYINYHREAVRPYEEVKREFLEAIEAVKLAEQEFTRLIEN